MKKKSPLHKVQPKCLVCGSDKVLFEEAAVHICDICGQAFEADSTCKSGHFVCHTCRQKAARQVIIAHCLTSKQRDPYILMLELMKLPRMAMHGPEHHLLLTATLLTAYCNTMGRIDLPELLEEANARSMQVPGGACGFWGVCGAAIGAGIFTSIITGASPYAEEEWKTSGQMTAGCAAAISKQGGPRCCKRDSFIALKEAIYYCNKYLNTDFFVPDISCQFYANNQECKGKACPFFPTYQKKGSSVMKQLAIDFLYLDLETCERCIATDETLKQAIETLSAIFDMLGYNVTRNMVNITSKELAEQHSFVSSPTIRMNGVDICSELVESACADCGDLCGDSVDCRMFVYEGKPYEQPPIPMIVESILKAIYGEQPHEDKTYTLPDNLEQFFAGKSSRCDGGCCCDTSIPL